MVSPRKSIARLADGIFPTTEPPLGDPIKVLIVEDEAEFAVLMKKELEGYHNIDAEVEIDPDNALQKIDGDGIDCVVSDYVMPEKNGLELLEEVRNHYPDLPFIFFTGKGSEEIAQEAFSAGATDYIIKDPEEKIFKILEERIRNAVRHNRDTNWRERSIQRQYLAIALAIISVIIGLASIII